jgi:hypothetical protein
VTNLSKDHVAHAEGWNGEGRTLCGIALEGFASGDTEVILLAAPGRMVTCDDCKRLIAHCQDRYTYTFKVRHAKS